MDDYVEAAVADMKSAIEFLDRELQKLRTGRATPKLVDSVPVEVASYGATMPLNQLATVQAPDARMLVVTPWDKSTLGDIERAILAAGLGLNPSNDGQIVRVPVPPLTAERRQALVKSARQLAEETKVRIRHVRREYNDTFKAAEKDGDATEDEVRRLLARIQEVTDEQIQRVDEIVAAKEKEILDV